MLVADALASLDAIERDCLLAGVAHCQHVRPDHFLQPEMRPRHGAQKIDTPAKGVGLGSAFFEVAETRQHAGQAQRGGGREVQARRKLLQGQAFRIEIKTLQQRERALDRADGGLAGGLLRGWRRSRRGTHERNLLLFHSVLSRFVVWGNTMPRRAAPIAASWRGTLVSAGLRRA